MSFGTCTEPLLPGQLIEHRLLLLKHGKPAEFFHNWMHHEGDEQVADPSVDEFTLRINLHKGDRILFEDGVLGRAFAANIMHTWYRDRPMPPGLYPGTILHWPRRRSLLQKWRDKRKAQELFRQGGLTE